MQRMMLPLALLCITSLASAQATAPTFRKVQLTDKFHCEGAYYGDFNKDGKLDVVAGPYWYEGPDFQKKHELYTPKAYDPADYSDNFLTFAHDFNADGWMDVLQISWPGKEATWYENPGSAGGHWKSHLVFDVVDNESPMLADLLGEGRPQLICNNKGYFGAARVDWANPAKPWRFDRISSKGMYHKYTHGLGIGDVNGDGRPDLIEAKGWWEHPADVKEGQPWIRHAFTFTDDAAQMYAYDVDGDGLNDIITVQHPHQYGLLWFKQIRKPDGQVSFEKNVIMGSKPEENAQGYKVSQLHAVALADMNGDGLMDIITGKRFWAHGPKGDVEPDAPAMLMWFELRRDKEKSVQFVAHEIDNNSGVGMQVEATDLNGDKIPDIVMASKKGSFVFLSQTTK